MISGSWDISFCRGKAEIEQDGAKVIIECPVRDKCHRFWTEEHTKEALRTGDVFHSFIMPGVTDITEKGCDHFWKEMG